MKIQQVSQGLGLNSVDATPSEPTEMGVSASHDSYEKSAGATPAAELLLTRNARGATPLQIRCADQVTPNQLASQAVRECLSPHLGSLDAIGIEARHLALVVLQPLAASKWCGLTAERLKDTPLAMSLEVASRELHDERAADAALGEQLVEITRGFREVAAGRSDQTQKAQAKASALLSYWPTARVELSDVTRRALVELARAYLDSDRSQSGAAAPSLAPSLAKKALQAIVTDGDAQTHGLFSTAVTGGPDLMARGTLGRLTTLADTHPACVRVEIDLAAGRPPDTIDLEVLIDRNRALLETVAAKKYEPNVAASLLGEYPMVTHEPPARPDLASTVSRLCDLARPATPLTKWALRAELRKVREGSLLALTNPSHRATALVAWSNLLVEDPSLATLLVDPLIGLQAKDPATLAEVTKSLVTMLEGLARHGVPIHLELEIADYLTKEQRQRLALASLAGGAGDRGKMCAVICATTPTNWIDGLLESEVIALVDWLDEFSRHILLESPTEGLSWANEMLPSAIGGERQTPARTFARPQP